MKTKFNLLKKNTYLFGIIFILLVVVIAGVNNIVITQRTAYALGEETIEQGKNENSDNTYSPTNEIKFFTEVMEKTVNKSAET